MRINVEQKHIDAGTYEPESCPIALALRDQVHHMKYPSVWADGDIQFNGRFYASASWPLYQTRASRRVQQFIKHFDNGKPVEPFSFNLKV